MEPNYEREAQKRTEILEAILDHFARNSSLSVGAKPLSTWVMKAFIEVTPPLEDYSMQLIVLRPGGASGGESYKAGNVRFNMSALITAVSSGISAAATAKENHVAFVFSAVAALSALQPALKIDISETDGVTLYVMWARADSTGHVLDNGLLDSCNGHLRKYGRPLMSDEDLRRSLRNLERIRAIRRSNYSANKWWLREAISLANYR
jgi:hypothetical protein